MRDFSKKKNRYNRYDVLVQSIDEPRNDLDLSKERCERPFVETQTTFICAKTIFKNKLQWIGPVVSFLVEIRWMATTERRIREMGCATVQLVCTRAIRERKRQYVLANEHQKYATNWLFLVADEREIFPTESNGSIHRIGRLVDSLCLIVRRSNKCFLVEWILPNRFRIKIGNREMVTAFSGRNF